MSSTIPGSGTFYQVSSFIRSGPLYCFVPDDAPPIPTPQPLWLVTGPWPNQPADQFTTDQPVAGIALPFETEAEALHAARLLQRLPDPMVWTATEYTHYSDEELEQWGSRCSVSTRIQFLNGRKPWSPSTSLGLEPPL